MSTPTSFNGFPPTALDFLRELEVNNEREWFEAHKHIYQNNIVAHVPAFVAELGEKLKTIAPGIQVDARVNGAGSMMRIYRDIRFSQDKTPYKTKVAFVFWEGPLKKMENPAFGFQFGAEGGELMAGQFMLPKELLTIYRQAVADEAQGNELVAILKAITGDTRYNISGERSKRIPTGYDANHPRAELLRYQGLYAHTNTVTPAQLTSADLVDCCFEHCRVMAPLQQWLVRLAEGK
ncbi:MAG: DUF2461 domain-containing protein [Caldilineaceae bacterium]